MKSFHDEVDGHQWVLYSLEAVPPEGPLGADEPGSAGGGQGERAVERPLGSQLGSADPLRLLDAVFA